MELEMQMQMHRQIANRRAALAAVLVIGGLAAACGGSGTEPAGLLAGGIIAGKTQVVVAGTPQLNAPVTMAMVRNETGRLTLRRVDDTWRDRALDLVVPRAYAQGTVVNGSPVVGAVVCAVSPDPAHPLVPFTPCTNTGSDGKATFFFQPGTLAGESRSEIRGTVANEPAVFDTATATVLPGPASLTYLAPQTPILSFPATVPTTSVVDAYGNAVAFRIMSDSRIVVQDTTTGSVGARTIVSGPDAQADFTVELRGAGGALVGHARYRITQGVLQYFIAGGVNTSP